MMIKKMLLETCDTSADGPKNTFVTIKKTSIGTSNMIPARSKVLKS